MTSNPSLAWHRLQDVFYSMDSCYDTLNWSIGNLYSDYKVRISPQSTMVALVTKSTPHPSLIDIYSVSGNKIGSVIYNSLPFDHIVDFGFHSENFFVVLTGHRYRYYYDLKGSFNEYDFTAELISLSNFGDNNVFGKFRSPSSTPSSKTHGNVITDMENNQSETVFQVLGTFIILNFLLIHMVDGFIISDLQSHTNYEVKIPPHVIDKIHCINLTSASLNGLSVTLSLDNTVISMNFDLMGSSYEIIDHELTDGPFTSITTSPNGSLIALLNAEVSIIFVINNSFDQVLLEYDASNDSSLPYQIEWCGNDAIVLALRDEVKLIGPDQRTLSFFYDVADDDDLDFTAVLKGSGNDEFSFTIPILKLEVDGLKILSTNKFEFLSRVSAPHVNLFQIGSSHPGSILIDCIDKLSQHSSKADINIALLKTDSTLSTAISESLLAAIDEFNPYWQKKILRAVSFAKAYCDEYYDSEKYLQVVNTLKVLNQLRSSEISLFLTYPQVLSIGWETVIDMLLLRDHHLLALKVISLLDLLELKDKVYLHWCCSKIKKEVDMEDIELFRIVEQKQLAARESQTSKNFLSMDQIAMVAYEEGRIDLCKLLIDLEPSTIKKVQQYLKFDEVELALIKSFQSGNYSLSKLILLHLKDTLTVSQFFKILYQNEEKPVIDSSLPDSGKSTTSETSLFVSGDLVEHFWINAIGKKDEKALELFFKLEDKKIDLALNRLKKFLAETEYSTTLNSPGLTYVEDYKLKLIKLLGITNDRKSPNFYQLEMDILNLRQRLSDTYQTDFLSTHTLTSILIKLINMHQLKQAARVVKDFRMSQEKFWHLVVETYGKSHEFERLHKFIVVSSKDETNLKSPIGFPTIVETCLAYKGPQDLIRLYINNSHNIHYLDKIEMHHNNGDLLLAAHEAYKYKDIEFLNSIHERSLKSGNDNEINEIKSLIEKLGY